MQSAQNGKRRQMQELLVSAAILSCHCVGFSYLNFEAYDSCFFLSFFFLGALLDSGLSHSILIFVVLHNLSWFALLIMSLF